jgi:hypothetical protein
MSSKTQPTVATNHEGTEIHLGDRVHSGALVGEVVGHSGTSTTVRFDDLECFNYTPSELHRTGTLDGANIWTVA